MEINSLFRTNNKNNVKINNFTTYGNDSICLKSLRIKFEVPDIVSGINPCDSANTTIKEKWKFINKETQLVVTNGLEVDTSYIDLLNSTTLKMHKTFDFGDTIAYYNEIYINQ